MDLHAADIAIHIINIVVLYVLLRILLYSPVAKFIQARKDAIGDELTQAKKNFDDAQQLKALYEQRLEQTEYEVTNRMMESNQQAHLSATAIVEDAAMRAEDLIAAAREKIKAERSEAVNALENEIAGMAVELARQIIQREISMEDQEKVIESFFVKAR